MHKKHHTGRKHHHKHHKAGFKVFHKIQKAGHKVVHIHKVVKKMNFLTQYKRTADDQCKTDVKSMMEDVEKMFDSIKAENQNATEATLKYIVDHMPMLEKQCQLSGDCAKDFWMVDGLAKRMYETTEKGDWNATDHYAHDMSEVFHKAHTDCQAGPSPDSCKTDAENLEADVHKIFESTKVKDQKAVEAELEYMIKELPQFESACHLEGQCKVDMDHIQKIAEWALNNTMAGDWNHTEEALKRMMEVFEEAKHDCNDHPSPPSPEECHKAEWVMEDTLQGLISSVGDKYQEGVMHFSAELEHRVFWIERACSLHDQCKSDWDRIGHVAHGIYDEAHRGEWGTVDAATMEVVELVKNDIHDDCTHNEEKYIDVITNRVGGAAQCLNDVKGIVTAAQDILKEAKSGKVDIGTIMKDVQEIVADVKAAETDCSLSTPVKVQAGDLAACI